LLLLDAERDATVAATAAWLPEPPPGVATTLASGLRAQVHEPLGIKKVMDAVVSATFNRYSFETMNLMRARVKRWEKEVRATRCKSTLTIPDCDKFDIDLAELSFDRVQDADEHDYLDRIPTAFTISPEEVTRLRRAARLLVEESPELRNFIEQSARSAKAEVP